MEFVDLDAFEAIVDSEVLAGSMPVYKTVTMSAINQPTHLRLWFCEYSSNACRCSRKHNHYERDTREQWCVRFVYR